MSHTKHSPCQGTSRLHCRSRLRETKALHSHYRSLSCVGLSSLRQQEVNLSNQCKPIVCRQIERAPRSALFMLADGSC